MIDRWKVAKQRIIKNLLGGQLIQEFPEEVQFELDDNAKWSRLNSFLETVKDIYHNDELFLFLVENSQDFYSNILSKDYKIFNKTIKKGTKILKAFKYFETDKEALRILQDLASRLIQENKVIGKLCISVHPLDFLSSSENTYNWRSCHALDGDYCAGNLSYITDSSTFICYLKGADNVKLPLFPDSVPWNSKKWRVLIHVDSWGDFMVAGRQYPFHSDYGLDKIKDMINESFTKDNMWHSEKVFEQWNNQYITNWINGDELYYRYFAHRYELIPLEDMVLESEGSMNYNDVLNSTCYTKPYYIFNKRATCYGYNINAIEVGSPVYCVHCGEKVTNSATMLCDNCEVEFGHLDNDDFVHCSCCDRRMALDDGCAVGEDIVCPECFEKECFMCPDCGEYDFNSESHWCEEIEDYICTTCYETRQEEK
jgi:hypothetical protein